MNQFKIDRNFKLHREWLYNKKFILLHVCTLLIDNIDNLHI